MPFPLPWFDNKIDPLLPQPQNIKPLLYNWDDYQTYDVLWYLPSDLRSYFPFYLSLREYFPLLGGTLYNIYQLNIPLFANDPLFALSSKEIYPTLIFFDRFTPWDYPWAEDYSTQLFHLIKKHCFPYF